jgi:membrane-associated phospholipid phosphatase
MTRAAPARLLIAIALACLAGALGLRAGHLDRALFLAINDAAWRWVPPALLSCVTILGHGLVTTMLLAPTLLRGPYVVTAGLFATPVALVLSWLPKALIDSPRPAAVLEPASIHIVGMRLAAHNSFPSGHAITAFLMVGVLLAAERKPPLRWPATVGIALTGIAVAASRIGVGAHWPSDVLAGAALGLVAGVAGAQAQRRWPISSPAARLALALLVLACAGTLAQIDVGYPMAQPLQLALAAGGGLVAVIALWRAWAARSRAARNPG